MVLEFENLFLLPRQLPELIVRMSQKLKVLRSKNLGTLKYHASFLENQQHTGMLGKHRILYKHLSRWGRVLTFNPSAISPQVTPFPPQAISSIP